jgi:hypothetical protein
MILLTQYVKKTGVTPGTEGQAVGLKEQQVMVNEQAITYAEYAKLEITETPIIGAGPNLVPCTLIHFSAPYSPTEFRLFVKETPEDIQRGAKRAQKGRVV